MSILGHDVDGRPLRAGDRVVLFRAAPSEFEADIGRIFTVTSPSRHFADAVYCAEPLSSGRGPGEYSMSRSCIRRIDESTDHQPSEYTFDSLMDHLKSGVPA